MWCICKISRMHTNYLYVNTFWDVLRFQRDIKRHVIILLAVFNRTDIMVKANRLYSYSTRIFLHVAKKMMPIHTFLKFPRHIIRRDNLPMICSITSEHMNSQLINRLSFFSSTASYAVLGIMLLQNGLHLAAGCKLRSNVNYAAWNIRTLYIRARNWNGSFSLLPRGFLPLARPRHRSPDIVALLCICV